MKKGECDNEKSHPPFFILEIYFIGISSSVPYW